MLQTQAPVGESGSQVTPRATQVFTQGNYSRTHGVSRRSSSSPLRGLESAGATPGSQTPRHLDLDALWRVFRPRLDWKSRHAQGAPEAESDPRKEVKSAILSIYR